MSRIKVDALQGTSGSDTAITLSGANATVGGTLAVTGVHTIGNNAVATSEGGANTINVAQGLAKGWCHLTGTGTPAAADSLNVGSITDTAAGRYTFNFSTNFGNANYVCVSGMCGNDGNTGEGRIQSTDATPATNAFAIRNKLASTNGARDDTNIFVTFHGDLA